ncbi:hypothetical protein BIW11_06990, partial [Tropilaelaps mercedesae]
MKLTILACLAVVSVKANPKGSISYADKCECTRQYSPVCLFGQTFPNRCAAECQKPDSDEIQEGECDLCVCVRIWAPVCYKGKTYGNLCEAQC